MTQSVQIIGNYAAPYVRKVLGCLELKGIAWSAGYMDACSSRRRS